MPLGEERFYSAQCAFPQRVSLLVRLETNDGLVGWGEGGQYGPPEPVAVCIKHILAPNLIGRSPHDLGCIWEELYALTRDFGQKGTVFLVKPLAFIFDRKEGFRNAFLGTT